MKISVDNGDIDLYPYPKWWTGYNVLDYSPAYTHLYAEFDMGAMEKGSSGSPLFDQNHRIKGQLHGGQVECPPNSTAYYGALFTSMGGGGTKDTRLIDWLDPYGAGNLQTNTMGRCWNTLFTNKTITDYERIICWDVEMENITVQQNAKLEIDANSVDFGTDFTVEEGGTLIINGFEEE
jgi:hypothetical protein